MSEMTSPTSVAVVDDDENLCRPMVRLLCTTGVRSVSYLSAEEFLADASRIRFDCLLLDIQLGGMSGIELSEQLADSGSTTPVFFFMVYNESEIRERVLRTGCIAYLRKRQDEEIRRMPLIS